MPSRSRPRIRARIRRTTRKVTGSSRASKRRRAGYARSMTEDTQSEPHEESGEPPGGAEYTNPHPESGEPRRANADQAKQAIDRASELQKEQKAKQGSG
jgi:hypothetical protein